MAGPLGATSAFGRSAAEGFLTHWTGPGSYSRPDPAQEPHCAPNDAGPPRPKRRRENPRWGDEARGLRPPEPGSRGWEAGTAGLGPPGPAPGGPRDPGLWLGSVLWTPACLGKALEKARQSSLEERQEARASHVHADVEKTPGNFWMEKEKGWLLSEDGEAASPGFLEAEEWELLTKKERDGSSQQKLREDRVPLRFPRFPRKEHGVLFACPKLDCFPKNEAEAKSMDMDVQESHPTGWPPFALASSLNAARMQRITKTWQPWRGIPLEADMVMGPPWPASVEFLDNPHTSPVHLYGNQSILMKNKWPHFISGPKTSGHLHPRCCQGA